ncbi:MAG: tRNA lysidine(34) synthetase TilS [Chitinophagales bacterium]
MTEDFLHFIQSQFTINKHSNILLAVSGGLDSVVMTHLFHKAQLNFGIAHCNFQLRGAESDADQKFVELLAQALNRKFYSVQFDTVLYQTKNKLSLEEAARDLRYQWLESIRSSEGYHFIATAHHLTDSFETTLLHLTKGAGVKGLSGIPFRNNKVIRPMLFTWRSAIENYAKQNGIHYRTDASNLSDHFTRNKIRNNILPILKEINPSLENTFKNTNQNLREANIIIDQHIAAKINKQVFYRYNAAFLHKDSINKLPYRNTFLYTFLKEYNFKAEQIPEITNSLSGSGKTYYSPTHRLIIDRKFLIITTSSDTEQPIYIVETNQKKLKLENCSFAFSHIHRANKRFTSTEETAYFNLQKITFPLTIRKWQKGDYMYPAGLYKANGNPAKKKISDLFTDAKYNILQKEQSWIVLSGSKIIWVAGLRQDEKTKYKPGNAEILKIKMLPG